MKLLSPYVLMFMGTRDYKLGASGGRAGQDGARSAGGRPDIDVENMQRGDCTLPTGCHLGSRPGAARSSCVYALTRSWTTEC